MKKQKVSASITVVLAIISVVALILQFLALSDIANHESDLQLEWYVVGVSLMIFGTFIISVFVTLALLFRNQD